jgi:hypothetical protein
MTMFKRRGADEFELRLDSKDDDYSTFSFTFDRWQLGRLATTAYELHREALEDEERVRARVSAPKTP